MNVRSKTRSVPLAVLLLGILILTIPFHLRPDNFIVDDGYFYPQIARYIAHGQGSTFNGIMLTNGYHPLWMLVCITAAAFVSSSSALVQTLGTVQDLLLLACVAVLVLIAREARLRGAVLGSVPLVFFGVVLGIWRLLETDLALALQLAILVLVVPVLPNVHARVGRLRSPLIGVLLGLTMLARLDLLFFTFIVLVYQVFERKSAQSFASGLDMVFLQSVLAVSLLAPYLAWNWCHFHHLVTISGAIKSTFPHAQRWPIQPFLYPVIAAILLNSSLLFRSARSNFDSLCLITAAAAPLHLSYTLSYGEMSLWYLTTGYLTVSLSMIWIVDLLIRRISALATLEPVLAGLVFIAFLTLAALRVFSNFTYTHLRLGLVTFKEPYIESKWGLAMKLRKTLPPGSRIMIFDAPGGVAFYSGMSILPLDGLVGDFTYNKEVVQQGVSQYAAAHHIDYFIAPLVQPDQTYDRLDLKDTRSGATQIMTVYAPLTHQVAGSLTLKDTDLLFRFQEINPDLETTFPEIGVWLIRH